MLLADSNILLALALSKHTFHAFARTWFVKRSPHEVALCRATQQSLLRLLTTRAVLAAYHLPPLTNQAAWSVYERLHADDRISWTDEPTGLEPLWKTYASRSQPSPKLWMDAYLAAFAQAGGHKLVTTDKAFKQFKGLDVLVLS